MKKHFGILPALVGAILLAGLPFPSLAAEKLPPMARFMQDSEECKEVALRPDSAGLSPAKEVVTSTYINCMTTRGYAEDDVKTRTHDSAIDFNAKAPPPPSMAPPGIPAAK
ncbi:MAG: hypothetical protein ACAH83_09595 [Alphaproteobacteria bacterium]